MPMTLDNEGINDKQSSHKHQSRAKVQLPGPLKTFYVWDSSLELPEAVAHSREAPLAYHAHSECGHLKVVEVREGA
jgi:hypothetical protein